MKASPKRRVEAWLYGKGFNEPVLRGMMLTQLLLFAVSAVFAVATVWLNGWMLMFALGAGVVLFNFWFMCRFFFRYFDGTYSRQLLTGHLLGFFGRLLVSGVVLGVAFALGGSPAALSVGVFSCVGLGTVVALLRLRAG
ncbi:MAG: ATP synthase subunit I [Deltaproteobacteria bacterium]|jgi:hypothetical protein|nr:ATP synthase subunit I [Deltaproteobacteria bacterium]